MNGRIDSDACVAGADRSHSRIASDSRTTAKPARPSYALNEAVFFVGFMGAGKTSLARRLARQCCCASIDLDRYIERIIDCSIAEFFRKEGEAAFRLLEAQVLTELAEGDPAFIACGGGIVEGEQNRIILSSEGYTVYLKVTFDEAMSRISNPGNRPLLADLDAARDRATRRESLYECVADAVVDTAGHTPRSISWNIKHCLLDAGVLLPIGR